VNMTGYHATVNMTGYHATVNMTGYHASCYGIKAGVSNGRYIGQICFAKGQWTMEQREAPFKFYCSRDENFVLDIPL